MDPIFGLGLLKCFCDVVDDAPSAIAKAAITAPLGNCGTAMDAFITVAETSTGRDFGSQMADLLVDPPRRLVRLHQQLLPRRCGLGYV